MSEKKIGFVIAEDHPIVRQGMRLLLSQEPKLQWLGDTGRGDEVWELVRRTQPDVLILDLGLPGLQGLEVMAQLRQASTVPKILVVTARQDAASLNAALDLGAQGYLLKSDDTDELIKALLLVADDSIYVSPALAEVMASPNLPSDALTDREREVVAAVAGGLSSKAAGSVLGISEHTVRKHRENISRKLNLRSPAQLVAWALRHAA